MMTRKNNVAMKESDDISIKSFVNYLNQLMFADKVKHFS